MDIAYFLLGMISSLMHIFYDVLSFWFEYVAPVINYFAPIVFEYLCLVTGVLLRIFFKYVSPCLLMLFDLATASLSYVLSAAGCLCLAIIELDTTTPIDLRVLLFLIIAISLYYYRHVGKALACVRDGGRLAALNTIYLYRVAKMCIQFSKFLYQRARRTVMRSNS